MSAQSALVLSNGAATPVPKTFTPLSGYNGPNSPAVWVLREGVSPMAYPRVEVQMRRTPNRATKVIPKLIVPYVTNDPIKGPTLVCTAFFDASAGFVVPDNAPKSLTDDLYAFAYSLLGSPMMKTWVTTLDPAN